MRNTIFLVTFLALATASPASDITSRQLIGTWSGGSSSTGDNRFIFRADHTFDGITGDAIWAGKWKLHHGNNLELIFYSDDERKIVSRSSEHCWILIKPIATNRMEMAYFAKDFPHGPALPNMGVWTKQR